MLEKEQQEEHEEELEEDLENVNWAGTNKTLIGVHDQPAHFRFYPTGKGA
jgi:hypothetical protein